MTIEKISDMAAARFIFEESIRRYGHTPEHNAAWFFYSMNPGWSSYAILWNDSTALMAHRAEKAWFVFSEPIAPRAQKTQRIFEFTEWAIRTDKAEKVVLELESGSRRDVMASLPACFRLARLNYSLSWPIMNMRFFDDNMPGGKWKDIRKARNGFYRNHRVEILDGRMADKAPFHAFVDHWSQKRTLRERAFPSLYHTLIDNDFIGLDFLQIVEVDGVLHGMNGGWRIPNSSVYYSAIGLHDYAFPDLGIVVYLADLAAIQQAGHPYANMGGGYKGNLWFKNRFQPESHYKTHIFSIYPKTKGKTRFNAESLSG